jgi:hypothetical protein
MPFSKDPGKRESDKYCSYCFQNGKLNAEGASLEDFKKRCYEGMIKNGTNKYLAKFFTWTIQFAPYWRNK